MKCQSWRLTTVAGHQHHKPGRCRECWKPCTVKVPRGTVRCHDCLIALVSSPDTEIRRGLLHEDKVTPETLQMLTEDSNPVIAATARDRLARTHAGEN